MELHQRIPLHVLALDVMDAADIEEVVLVVVGDEPFHLGRINAENGFDVIAMTNLPEAKLAREAEIAFVTMAMITDYDSWKIEEEPVSAEIILSHLFANAETARKVIADVIPRIPNEPNWPEHSALDAALVTDRKLWPEATKEKLGPILARFVAE